MDRRAGGITVRELQKSWAWINEQTTQRKYLYLFHILNYKHKSQIECRFKYEKKNPPNFYKKKIRKYMWFVVKIDFVYKTHTKKCLNLTKKSNILTLLKLGTSVQKRHKQN